MGNSDYSLINYINLGRTGAKIDNHRGFNLPVGDSADSTESLKFEKSAFQTDLMSHRFKLINRLGMNGDNQNIRGLDGLSVTFQFADFGGILRLAASDAGGYV